MQYYFQKSFTNKTQRHYKILAIQDPVKKEKGEKREKNEWSLRNGRIFPGVLAQGRNQRDKFSKTPRLTTTTPRTRPRRPGSHPSRLAAANRQGAPLQSVGCSGLGRASGRAPLTYPQFAPQPGSPGGRGAAGRKGDASVHCGNRGTHLGLAPTWESCLPLAQQQFLGRATQRTGTKDAHALILLCRFPPELPRVHTPPPSPKYSSWPGRRPFPASSQCL